MLWISTIDEERSEYIAAWSANIIFGSFAVFIILQKRE